eukprot:2449412-Rhodomonas_salina.2
MTAHIATLERQKLNLLARLQVGRLTPQVSPLDQIVDKALDHGAGRQILQVNATDFEGTTQVPIETSAPFHTTAVTAAVTAADVAAPENSTSEVAAGATPSATTNQGGNTDSGVETTARMATPQPTNPVEVVTPQGYELSVKTKLTGVTLVEFEANVLSFETQVALLLCTQSYPPHPPTPSEDLWTYPNSAIIQADASRRRHLLQISSVDVAYKVTGFLTPDAVIQVTLFLNATLSMSARIWL